MSTAATAEFHNSLPAAANDESNVALPLRGDTFLGVCEAVGQDLGFNPNWLRIPFAALILWNPVAIIGIYLGLGGVVAVSRWFYPAPSPATVETPASAPANGSAAAAELRESEKSNELLAA